MSIMARVGWALLNKHLNVLMHMGHIESPNWVASCVEEYNWILFGPPTVCPLRHTRGRRHKGEVRPDPAFWSRRELLPLMVSSGPACVMLSGLYPCKVDHWFESPRRPRTWVMACSLCLNIELSTSYQCDDNYMKNDYLVVMVYDNQYCLDTFTYFE
jgi:hypothetical protein